MVKTTRFRIIPRVARYGKDAKEALIFLPGIPATPGMTACYARVGEHGEVALDFYRRKHREAGCEGV